MRFDYYGIDQSLVDTFPFTALKVYLDGNTDSEIDFREAVARMISDYPTLTASGGGGGSLPDGGTTGQLLVKQSAVNGDALWENLILTGGDANG